MTRNVADSLPGSLWRTRLDLICSRQGSGDESIWIIKDPISRRFFRFREAEHFITQQLDGITTPEVVRQRVEEKFGATLPAESLEQFIQRLRKIGLITDGASPAAMPRPRRVAGDIFYLRCKAFDPDRLFDALITKIGFLFTRSFVAVSAMTFLCAIGITIGNWAEIRHAFIGLFQFQSLLLAWFVMLAVITLHEFAHGLTCKRFGGHVHELGFMLIYFQPAFYCNVSDAWLFPEKSKRLWVTFAGAYFELYLWALATMLWRITDSDTTINHLALVVAATSGIRQIFNLNPLIKLDGYYLLSDHLNIPNLRAKAFQYLKKPFVWFFGGGTVAPKSGRERAVFIIYGLLAIIYTCWLLTLVLGNVGGFLVTRYEAWGFVVWTGLLTGLFRHPVRRFITHIRAESGVIKNRVRRIVRGTVFLALIGGIGAALWFWRMELKVSGEFIIVPIRNAEVRAEVEGIIQEIPHEEGDVVKAGDVIARLSDRDTRAELRKLAAETEEKRARLKILKIGARREEIELAKASIGKAEERLKFARAELDRTKVLFTESLLSRRDFETREEEASLRDRELDEARKRFDVISAGSRPEEIEALEADLARTDAQRLYHEELLKLLTVKSPVGGVVTTRKLKEKTGQLVEKGDLVAVVQELETVTAEIAVSEKDISDVAKGATVFLKARAHPHTSFAGTVVSIAPVASKSEDWREQRTVIVVTQLDNRTGLLRPAMSGRAKIYCGEQRALDLMLRRLVRYLRVEFWSWW